MSDLLQYVPALAAIAVAVLSLLNGHLVGRNRSLKRRLRRALRDCQRFHRLEEIYAEEIASGVTQIPTIRLPAVGSAVSIKRAYREKLRVQWRDGSPECTPEQVRRDIEALS